MEFIVLNLAVFAAAALQAATGIGFGIIAGPILLIVYGDASAIQVSIVLNLLIAALLTPVFWRQVDFRLVAWLVAGIVFGAPLGVWLFQQAGIAMLKLGAAATVLFTLTMVMRGNHRLTGPATPRPAAQATLGVVAGIMASSLAMPGPVPAAWMAARGYDKTTIRASILAMFIAAYSVALLLQAGLAGIGENVGNESLVLVPATVLGIVLGRILGDRLDAQVYRRILIVVLAATALLLAWSVV